MEGTSLYQALVDQNEEEALKHLDDSDVDFTARNAQGQTFLHIAAKQLKSLQVVKVLLGKVDFSTRDDDGNSAIDLMFEDEEFPEEVETAIQEAVRERIMESKKEELRALFKAGWLYLWLKDDENIDDEKEDLKQFTADLPTTVVKVEKLHKAIQDGDLEAVKEVLEDGSLFDDADCTGFPPLHKAVILGESSIAEYIVKTFPESLKVIDNMGRTALHHAAGRRDGGHLYQLLTDAGAEDDIQDLNLKTPKDIYENVDLLPGEVTAEKLAQKLAKPVLKCKKKKEQEQQEDTTQTTTETTVASEKEEKSSKPATPAPQKPEEDPNKPVQMYISPDVRPNPPPTTIDGKYVADHLGNALTAALSEIAERRPWDPIEYLANWLYKYQENVNYNKRQHELLAQIRAEEETKRHEREVKEKRRAELQRLQEEERKKAEAAEEERKRKEQEELQRKAKEAALSQQPGLETVMEDKEEDETPKEKSHKDENGQTELHKLASQNTADLTTLLNMGYSPADRDSDNKTARDIAEEHNIKENVEAIDKYVQKLIEMGEFEALQDLFLAGYDKFEVVVDKLTEQSTSLPDETQNFLKQLPDFKENIKKVLKAVQTEGLQELTEVLEEKKVATAKDEYGRSPLHIAVLVGHKEAAEHLASHFPVTMKCKDNIERTPLHYAYAVSEEMVAILEKHGADTLAQDAKQRVPSYYKSNPDEITALKGSLSSPFTGTQEQTQAQTSQQETTEQQQEAGHPQQEA